MSERLKWAKPELLSLEAREFTAATADLVPNDDFQDAHYDGFHQGPGTADSAS